MPIIFIYVQAWRRWDLDSGDLVEKWEVASFEPLPDQKYQQEGYRHAYDGVPFHPFRGPRGERVLKDDPIYERGRIVSTPTTFGVEAKGGETPVRVKIPIDARLDRHAPGCPLRVVWDRSPLTWWAKDLQPQTRLTAGQALAIARGRIRAAKGLDTFNFVEANGGGTNNVGVAGADAPWAILDREGDDGAAGVGGDRGGLRVVRGREGSDPGIEAPGRDGSGITGDGRLIDHDDDLDGLRDTGRGGSDLHDPAPGGAEAGHAGDARRSGGPGAPAGGARRRGAGDRAPSYDFPAARLRVIPPPGAEPIGGTEAPTLLVAGPRLPGEGGPARMAVAWDLLPEMARLGWYGLRWEPTPVSTAIDPYTAERMGPKPTRRAKAEPVGQGMLF